jgi:4-hydroxybenzoate polyprenyltransferase
MLRYNQSVPLLQNTKTTLEMIKWEHSIFALPFALCGAMLAANGLPSGRQLFWIVVAMVGARSAAMAFNRLVDAKFDAQNPRTSSRAIPAGALSKSFVALFVVASSALLVLAAYELNWLAFRLSPVALAIVLLYSYTKRFTRWSHLVLGFALGVAPAAAWIAVKGNLDLRILLLTFAVTFWVAGFDVLYACQDIEFDRAAKLYSIPCLVGVRKALIIARLLHLTMFLFLLLLVLVFGLGKIALLGIVIVALLLGYEHSLVRSDDLSKLNAAFFTMNGVIAVVFFVFVAADKFMRH